MLAAAGAAVVEVVVVSSCSSSRRGGVRRLVRASRVCDAVLSVFFSEDHAFSSVVVVLHTLVRVALFFCMSPAGAAENQLD